MKTTWKAKLPTLVEQLTRGSDEACKNAAAELARMADLADRANDEQEIFERRLREAV